eukprot:1093376-Rhodomonas_salina.2
MPGTNLAAQGREREHFNGGWGLGNTVWGPFSEGPAESKASGQAPALNIPRPAPRISAGAFHACFFTLKAMAAEE